MFTKKQITSAIKITVLSAILIVGLNYVNAAWSGPTANPPSGGIPTPVNISSVNQVKNGGLGVNALSVFGDGLISRDMTATEFCFTDGTCISAWSQLKNPSTSQTPTVSLTANPTNVAYNGQTTLTWSSTNATSCSANWTSSTATNGTATKTNLTTSTTYTITCTGTNGSAQASATVTVGLADCTQQTWWKDADADGYGDSSISTTSCVQPIRFVKNNTDCDDSYKYAFPGAPFQTETSDYLGPSTKVGWDLNCDGVITKKYVETMTYCPLTEKYHIWARNGANGICIDNNWKVSCLSESAIDTSTINCGQGFVVPASSYQLGGYVGYAKNLCYTSATCCDSLDSVYDSTTKFYFSSESERIQVCK